MDEAIILEILWTDSAKSSFDNIINYLNEEWTEKEVEKFMARIIEMLETIKRYPEICRPSGRRKNVRTGIVNKHTQIVYHYTKRKKRIKIYCFGISNKTLQSLNTSRDLKEKPCFSTKEYLSICPQLLAY